MLIPGIVSATFRERSADEILELCRKAELKAIEWSENAHVMPNDEAGAAALYERTRAAGLAIAAYGSYYRLGQQENPQEVFAASLVSAVALHAPIIRIWAGNQPSENVDDNRRKELAAEAKLVCQMAAESGIRVALEWHRNTLTDTNQSAVKFLEEVDHQNLYCLWQPTLALSMKERMEGLDLVGNRLLNLHMYYWPDGVRRPFSEGVEVWKQYLKHVDLKADRFGLLEFVMGDTPEQFLEDARCLHQMLRELQDSEADV